MLWDKEKQTWSDKIATTVVVPVADYPVEKWPGWHWAAVDTLAAGRSGDRPAVVFTVASRRASSRRACVSALPRRARFVVSLSQELAPEG